MNAFAQFKPHHPNSITTAEDRVTFRLQCNAAIKQVILQDPNRIATLLGPASGYDDNRRHGRSYAYLVSKAVLLISDPIRPGLETHPEWIAHGERLAAQANNYLRKHL